MKTPNIKNIELLGTFGLCKFRIFTYGTLYKWTIVDGDGNRIAGGAATTIPNAKSEGRYQFYLRSRIEKQRWKWVEVEPLTKI